MTLGELALMINGESWLPEGRKCDLTVIPCKNYTHQTRYELPIAPSPNLPNMHAIYLYSSTCLFEGTVMSLGRGTPTLSRCMDIPVTADLTSSLHPVACLEPKTRHCSIKNVMGLTFADCQMNRSLPMDSICPM